MKLLAGLAEELSNDTLWYRKNVRATLKALCATALLSVEVILARLTRNKRAVLGHTNALGE